MDICNPRLSSDPESCTLLSRRFECAHTMKPYHFIHLILDGGSIQVVSSSYNMLRLEAGADLNIDACGFPGKKKDAVPCLPRDTSWNPISACKIPQSSQHTRKAVEAIAARANRSHIPRAGSSLCITNSCTCVGGKYLVLESCRKGVYSIQHLQCVVASRWLSGVALSGTPSLSCRLGSAWR